MSGDLEAKSRYYTHTHISVQKFCYEWTISNFSFCMGGSRKEITSPLFSSEPNEEVAWCLRVYPNGVDEESKDYLSVFLELLTHPESPVWAKYEFWIINCQGEKFQCMMSPNVINFLQNEKRGFEKFILRDLLLSNPYLFLPEDQLTLCCKVSIVGGFYSIPGQNMKTAIKDSRHRWTDDLGEVWKNSLFTDCCLLVGGHEFRAHKAILAACSPVFRAMFEHEMKEK
ncbi:TD and POZ domain-containing protein 1-like, partial [Grammomys surdaster]|uniref:TD and POZ domain-containing protein 1-like n=1 Tax=Grammomys surdaster TaxID=491861 RepID=UPI00109F4511